MGDTPVHEDTMLLPGAVAEPAPAQPTSPLGGRLPADVLAEGVTVGEYRVEKLLGEGGMGQVYAAKQPIIGKRVAIKVLKAAFSNDAELVRRFLGEARAVNKIGHPNIIDIFSFGQLPDGRQYFVMEFLEGQTLGERMQREPLETEEAKRLLIQACHALEAAHREKVVHRDLKPDNLWVARPKHGDSFIKVLDFGIAKLIETEMVNVTQTGVTMGTPMYMSPEQCIGQNVDHRTDIYALGAILYQVFAGRLPFDGHSFAEVVAQQLTAVPPPPSQFRGMPAALEKLILSCLEKDAGKRPQTAAELAVLLEAALAPGGAAAVPMPPTVAIDLSALPMGAVETRQGFAGHEAKRATYSPSASETDIVRPGRRTGLLAALVGGGVLVVVAAILLLTGGQKKPAVVSAPPPPATTLPPAGPPRPAAIAPTPPATTPPPALPPPTAAPAPTTAPTAATPAPPAAHPPRASKRTRPAEEDDGAGAAPARRRRVDDRGLVKDNPY
jgi:eukaryotic-like serine/threonine-protein kinase